ncbi:MAG: oxidoreductase, partial [Bacteroidota bacterium]
KSKKWTAANVPDLKGQVILVTGGNSGLGFEAAKLFAAKEAEVIIASRSLERGEQAKATILETSPKANLKVMQLDLSDLGSVRKFADAFLQNYDQLHVLHNNAGIMMCPYEKTKDGFESQMGVNHLGHFALTAHLLELLKKTPKSRVVNVSSLGHRRGKMNFDNLLFENGGYSATQAYFNSKLANLLFTYELQRKFEAHGLDILSVAAHPGGSATNLARHLEKKWWFTLIKPLFWMLAQSAAIGTLPQVRASVDADVKGGEYYGPRKMGEARGYPILVDSTDASKSLADAKKFWQRSEELTGIVYAF